ncbi:aldo-keto reductase [Pseudoneurospora amorphoporcata]|uniref:Aldo-keto reductase n=1 Tax=Pseudoneurospora amorphoporcata TaxID=241081 RepID=A0AAN6SDV6_9PEZI|nr:aldo-keto reductase [Pseudoneurospora amorphoporcata]
MDKVLQTGLALGMSTTSGFHTGKPKPAPRELDGLNILPPTFCPTAKDRISFPAPNGKVDASYICIGGWPWGDKGTWHYTEDEWPAVQAAWRELYDAGINFIDTAQAYGNGESERLIGKLVKGLPRDSYVIQTKWLGTPLDVKNYVHASDAPYKTLKGSLERLELDYVDIYLVHGPTHPQSIMTVAEGLAKCVSGGLTRAVGVANYPNEKVLEMKAELARYGIPLATNQVEYSILRRYPEVHGEIKTCVDNGMVFQGYSAIAQGRLSGKYTVENPPPKTYRFSSYPMEDIQETLAVLEKIAKARGKAMASVALNYNISKGVVPVVGIRKPEQARQAIEALGWRLSEAEMVELDRVSVEGTKTVFWQQG